MGIDRRRTPTALTLPTILAVACGPSVIEGCRVAAERALAVLRVVTAQEILDADRRHPSPLAVVLPEAGPRELAGLPEGTEVVRIDESLAASQVEAIVSAAAARAARRRLAGEGRYSIVNPCDEEAPYRGRTSSSATPIARLKPKRSAPG